MSDKKTTQKLHGREVWDNILMDALNGLIEHMVSNANDLQGAGATCMVGEGDKYRKELRDHIRQSIIQHEKELWDQTRRRPFGRMRVKRFSHLFPSEGDLVSGSEYLSRRVLPGFFAAIEMMTGPEMFEKRHLAPAEDYAFEGLAVHDWQMDEEALLRLLNALFSTFSERLATTEGREKLSNVMA